MFSCEDPVLSEKDQSIAGLRKNVPKIRKAWKVEDDFCIKENPKQNSILDLEKKIHVEATLSRL